MKSINREALQQELYLQQRVIVRVWTSQGNPHNQGHNVGHISLETASKYMSLWPKQAHHPFEESAKESEGKGIASSISHELLPSYNVDLKYENRKPEIVLCFYSLDVHAIEEKFEKFQQTLKGWSLLGLCEDAESCASMAWQLLQAGKIEKLASSSVQSSISSQGGAEGSFISGKKSFVSSYYASTLQKEESKGASTQSMSTSSFASEMAVSLVIKSPDALAVILKKAKEKELEQHPLTKNIAFTDESEITADHENKKSCAII